MSAGDDACEAEGEAGPALCLSHAAMTRLDTRDLLARGVVMGAPERYAALDLSHNALTLATGLEPFARLTRLDLSHNGISTLDGAVLPATLECLRLAHNGLASLLVYPPAVATRGVSALAGLARLRVLDVAFNRLETLRGVGGGGGGSGGSGEDDGGPALRVLRAEGNQLRGLAGVEECRALKELHAHRNMIREAADVAAVRGLRRLRVLTLGGNPFVSRKRQVSAAHALLPPALAECDLPEAVSGAASSLNTSRASAAGNTHNNRSRCSSAASSPAHPANLSSVNNINDSNNNINSNAVTATETVVSDPPPILGSGSASYRLDTSHTREDDMSSGSGGPGNPPRSGGSAPAAAARLACIERAVDSEAFARVSAERDAYAAECARLRERVAALEAQLTEQREATVMALRISEQIQKRVQGGAGGVAVPSGAPAAKPPVPAAAAAAAPPLLLQPPPLFGAKPPLPSESKSVASPSSSAGSNNNNNNSNNGNSGACRGTRAVADELMSALRQARAKPQAASATNTTTTRGTAVRGRQRGASELSTRGSDSRRSSRSSSAGY